MSGIIKGRLAEVVENHGQYGREWKNKIGRVNKVTRKSISLDMGDCVIHVPKNKVISQ